MPISEPYELDGVTVGATELSIVSGTTTLQAVTDDGLYQLFLDPVGAGVAKGDGFTARFYEKVLSGSTKRLAARAPITRITQSEIWTFPPLLLLHGWDMTLQKELGTDRAWDASIRAVTGAGITERNTLSAVTVGATELSVVSGTTTLQTIAEAGYYQLWIDAVNMAKGDDYIIRGYEKVEATGGVKRLLYKTQLMDVQSNLFYSPILQLKNGWDWTIQKSAGTDRAFDASLRRVAG